MNTDPYGNLEYCIGDEDDFWCFDFDVDRERRVIRLHAVINSETGSFIQDAEPPIEVPYAEAVTEAQRLVDGAIDWLFDPSGHVVEHDVIGWNQDPQFFVRTIEAQVAWVEGRPAPKVERTIIPEDEVPTYHIRCRECGNEYDQTFDPERCGVCGSRDIEVTN